MYLSSYRIGDSTERLVEMTDRDLGALVIANAMDFLDGSARRDCVLQEVDDLAHLGVTAEEVDLRDFFGAAEQLATRLHGKGLIWVRGGNTFILRRAMRESGFDAWLVGQTANPTLVYGGYSAGIVLLGKTLRGLELVDPPHQVPPGYPSEVVWGGLGLIDYSIAPHYKSDHPESEAIDKVVAYFEEYEIDYRTLRDGEVITIE